MSDLESGSKTASKEHQAVDIASQVKEVDQDTSVEEKESPETTPSLPKFPDGGLEAWTVVLGVFFLNFSTFGVAVSWGAFQAYYEQTLLRDYSSSTIAWIGSLQFALIFMPGVVTGRLLDLGYHKLPLGLASCLLVICAFLIAECKHFWQFLLCQGIGVGLASGFIFPPTLGLVSQWFHLRRARAFGVTACGTSLGGIVFPIMFRNLLPSVGFKWTVRIIAFVMTFALTIGFFTTRRRLPPRPINKFFNPETWKSASIIFYCSASFFAFLGMYAVLTFLVVSAQVKSIDANFTFYLVAIMNAASIFGRLSAGLLGDRYGPLNVIAPVTLGAAAITWGWPYAHNVAGFAFIAIFYGICFGGYVGLLPSPSASLGPIQSVGERIGVQLTVMSIASLVGPPISGAIREHPLGFRGASAYAGVCITIGAIFMVLTKRAATGKWVGGKI